MTPESWGDWLDRFELREDLYPSAESDALGARAWAPDQADANVAWEMAVELRTRIATQPHRGPGPVDPGGPVMGAGRQTGHWRPAGERIACKLAGSSDGGAAWAMLGADGTAEIELALGAAAVTARTEDISFMTLDAMSRALDRDPGTEEESPESPDAAP